VAAWLLEGLSDRAARLDGPAKKAPEEERHPWWRVMCLTGVDYFSTLGYQPGIAALAAGTIAPFATLVLIALTVFGALPVYRRVATESPHGEGSVALLERALPWWAGKAFVLVLLGFAMTSWIITITLSSADASVHLLENPLVPAALHGHQLAITVGLLLVLAAVFLRGFSEAIGIAVGIVAVYLVLNAVVLIRAVVEIAAHPSLLSDWQRALTIQHPNPLAVVGLALVALPRLALGLSGFETGVAVMPQISGDESDTEARPTGRIRGAHRLLLTAALIMSVYLALSSIATTVLIPASAFQPGGKASGRALAYLAHEKLGDAFGTVYDASTIAILWFAGASAMAGLLNLVPRYLPRYGMAPRWARALRPLVLVFTATAVLVTWLFHAGVDAQAGAYATGVLVLITSASIAAALVARRRHERRAAVGYAAVAAVFVVTTAANMIDRPDGLRIGALFIAAILLVSLASRATRAFDLRAASVRFDSAGQHYLAEAARCGALHIVANEPDERNAREYRDKAEEVRKVHSVPRFAPLVFLEVTLTDPSDFETDLDVRGEDRYGYRVLSVHSPAVANTIAELLLDMRDRTGLIPNVYFTWTEGNPVVNLLRFLAVGEGEIAPVTREVLRRAEPDPDLRPRVHVG
jgi:hypothetical protein